MRLERKYNDGVMLSRAEIKELADMYKSGKYYVWGLREYFGISEYEYKWYMAIAYDLGFIDDKTFENPTIKNNYKLKY